jgi:hypothetical protein
MLPFAEWRPDASDLGAGHTRNLRNVVPRSDGYGPVKSLTAFTGALPAACRGAFAAQNTDGTVTLFAGTSTKLYVMSNTDFTWSDASLAAGTYTALATDADWVFAQYNTRVIATQKNAVMQTWTLGSSSAFANLAGSPPQAGWVGVVGRHLVACDLLSNPFDIHWSALNDVTGWTAGTSQSDTQTLPDGGRARAVVEVAGGLGFIIQEQALRRMTWMPGSGVIFQIDRVPNGRGTITPYSVVVGDDGAYWLSPRGFVHVTPGGVTSAIGEERVDRTFLGAHASSVQSAIRDLAWDSGAPRLVRGVADPEKSLIVWVYRSAGQSASLFNKGMAYHTQLKRWAPFELSGECIVPLSRPGLTLEALDSISSSLDALAFSLDDVSTATLPSVAAFDSTHKAGFLTGSTLESELETAEQSNGGRRIYVNGLRPITDAGDVYCATMKRENLNEEPTEGDESEMDSDGNCPVLEETRYARGKARVPAGTNWSFASGIEPEHGAAGWF